MPPRDRSEDERLLAAYREAALRISRTLKEANGRNRRILLRRVDQILQELEQLSLDYIQTALPLHYKDGAEEAIQQLRMVRGFGEIADSFGTIHTEAVAALADDAALRFANSLEAVRRESRSILTAAEKQKVLGEIIASEIEGVSNPAKRIQDTLEKQGIVSFRGANRNWEMDVYSAMLVDTILTDAHNTGAQIRYVENGVSFAQVIERETACKICRPMNGKIVSLADRRVLPGYHPHCHGAIRPFLGVPVDPIMSIEDERIPEKTRDYMRKKG